MCIRDRVDGRSLGKDLLAYSESLYPSLNLGWSELHGIEAGSYRFIRAPRPELYDLAEDPGERENLIDSNPTTADQLERSMEKLLEPTGLPVGHAPQLTDSRTAEMLRSLGYISTDHVPPSRGASLADPKDRIGLWTKIEAGLALFNRGDDAGALEVFTTALAEDADIPFLYDHIGWAYMRLNQYDRAERVYRQAIERGFDSADLRANLGLIYSRWREFEKAEQELQTALMLEEGNLSARYRLADVYRATRNYSKAVQQYRSVLEIDPGYVWALNGLGMTLAMEGKNDEALAAFRDAVRIAPQIAPGYLNLAVHLERMKRFPEALEAYKKFMELSSEEEFARQRGIATAAIQRLEAQKR